MLIVTGFGNFYDRYFLHVTKASKSRRLNKLSTFFSHENTVRVIISVIEYISG